MLEINDVVNRLKEFNPTIICLENGNSTKQDSFYQAYRKGDHVIAIDEEELLGFRVAKELGLEKVYATNTRSWLYDNYDNYPEEMAELWNDKYYLDTLATNLWHDRFNNILKTNPQSDDRILVIYSASYVAIFRTIIRCIPTVRIGSALHIRLSKEQRPLDLALVY